jgi:anti-repressor protein
MNDLITISGVSGYFNSDGTAWLSLKDVSFGLGFTQFKGGVEYIRWERVNGYLTAMGFPQLVGKEFIPENVFFRLALKGETDAAVKFQEKVADEILPSIRKHGAYMTPSTIEKALLNPDTIIQLATQLKDEQEKRKAAESKIEADKSKVLFADSVAGSSTSILIRDLAKMIQQNGYNIGEKRLFQWLRENGYLISKSGRDYNRPTQKSMGLGVMEVKETSISHANSTQTAITPLITGKGQKYFINKILNRS